jgi:peptide/nickel transport system permease protein
MFAYLVRRMLYMVPILIGICLLTFVLLNVVGGDPVLPMLGKHANAESIAALRHELGLDRPLYMQFLDYLRQIVTFDFGRSYSNKQQISDLILRAAPVSLCLMIPAFFISIIVAISLALFVAFKRGTLWDRITVLFCVFGVSFPMLGTILFAQYFLAFKLDLFPISGFSFGLVEGAAFLALPSLIYISVALGGELRFFRTVMLDEINQDYIRTARAKGLNERVVMFKHVLKNAMIPIITSVVIEIPFLITGAILLENFFSIPGMGSMMVDALNTSDFPTVKAITAVMSILYMLFNLLTDFLYAAVDPRIKLQ